MAGRNVIRVYWTYPVSCLENSRAGQSAIYHWEMISRKTRKCVETTKHICFDICMPIRSNTPPQGEGVKTGRRQNPTIDGPRDRTVCFMLSENEKSELDRVAFCLNLTRSGLLASVVAPFIEAVNGGKNGEGAKQSLDAFLEVCRKAMKERGDLSRKVGAPNQ